MIYSVNYLCSGLSTYVCTLIYQTITFHIFSSTVSKQITCNHFWLKLWSYRTVSVPKNPGAVLKLAVIEPFLFAPKINIVPWQDDDFYYSSLLSVLFLLTAGGSKVRLCIFEATVARGKGLWPWRRSTSTLALAAAQPSPPWLPSIWSHQHHYQHHH